MKRSVSPQEGARGYWLAKALSVYKLDPVRIETTDVR